MNRPKFLTGSQFKPELTEVVTLVRSCVDGGETDSAAIIEKARQVATNPLAVDFCDDPYSIGDCVRDLLYKRREQLEAPMREAEWKKEAERAEKLAAFRKAEADALAARQQAMKDRRTALPPKPEGKVSPRGKFRVLSRDSRYRINKHGEVIGPQGTTLRWDWDLKTAIPSVKVGGKRCSILSLLQDVGFQKRKESKARPKPAPTANDSFEAAAEDPEANPPKGFNSWDEARAEDPETYPPEMSKKDRTVPLLDVSARRSTY